MYDICKWYIICITKLEPLDLCSTVAGPTPTANDNASLTTNKAAYVYAINNHKHQEYGEMCDERTYGLVHRRARGGGNPPPQPPGENQAGGPGGNGTGGLRRRKIGRIGGPTVGRGSGVR